ncbi:MAG: RnfABCDGE type electron transport complex subunit B [Limnochordia bacterium]|nr:RnfABCDGE type electron transport complex subunit B [Limnochordia bacterium]
MNDILVSAVSMGILGTVFGFGLVWASQRFKVESDPRIDEIADAAPGANCGSCGFAGCRAYAEAVVEGRAEINACPVGGSAFVEKIASLLGKEATDIGPRKVAHVKCGGCNDKAKQRGDYDGALDCRAAVLKYGGPKECQYGCLGLGSCVKVCAFDAIHLTEVGLPEVDADTCTACGKCIQACPRSLLELVPVTSTVHVQCKSTEKGKVVRSVCEVGCIGCGLCVKACSFEAITVTDNLASIDYTKCTNCGQCALKCPTKAIIVQDAKGQQSEEIAG